MPLNRSRLYPLVYEPIPTSHFLKSFVRRLSIHYDDASFHGCRLYRITFHCIDDVLLHLQPTDHGSIQPRDRAV